MQNKGVSQGPRRLTTAHGDTGKPVPSRLLWALMYGQSQHCGAEPGIAGSGS